MTSESVVRRVPRSSAYFFDGTRGAAITVVTRLNNRSVYKAEFKVADVGGVEIPDAVYIEVQDQRVVVGTPPLILTKDTWVVFDDKDEPGGVKFLSNREYRDMYRRATDDD